MNENIPDWLQDFDTDEQIEYILNETDDEVEEVTQTIETVEHKKPEEDINPGGIIGFFLMHGRLTLIAIIAVLLMGLTGLTSIDIEANPEITQPSGIVQTFYPNSSPADVEEQITDVLEEEIAGLSELKQITSTSTNNLSTIQVDFNSSADTDEVIQDLQEAVNRAAGQLPDDANTPQVIEFDFNTTSIVSYSLVGPQSKKELSELAETISDQMDQVTGVSKTELSGDVTESVKILLDPVRLEFYQVSLNQIIQTLNGSNINAPLGSIKKDEDEINLRLLGKVENIEQLKKIPIANTSTESQFSLITLDMLGEIDFSPNEQKTDSFVSVGDSKAQNAVTLSVFKQKGGNIVNIVEQIELKVEELRQELPEGTEIIKTNDNSFFIRNDIQTLSTSGLQTIVIIFLALMVFLTAREALVAALAIPLIFFITFGTIYFTGQTLNGLTIFSLILSLGLIVDTSIVIVEGIHDNRKEGLSKQDSAAKSLKDYKWPLIAGTATTLAAFAPMLLVSGIVGDFIKTIPIVLSITLGGSLIVSFLFTPKIATRILKTESKKTRIGEMKDNGIQKLRDIYESLIESILHSKALKTLILILTLVLFIISMTLPVFKILKAELFPVVDVPFMFINIEAPLGTDLEKTREMIGPIEEKLDENEAVQNYVLNLGRLIDTGGFGLGQTTIRSNYAHIVINLTEDVNSRQKSYQLTSEFRDEFQNIDPDLKVTVEEISSGPPVAAPFEARISGPDLEKLEELSLQLSEKIEGVDGFVNISNEFDDSPDEVQIILDQDKLSYYQVSNQQVALILQTFTSGIDGGSVKVDAEEYDLRILFNTESVKNIGDLQNFPVATPKGVIPLSYLGRIETTASIKSIPRIDQERSVRVRAFLDEGQILGALIPLAEEQIDQMELPQGYTIDLGGQDEEVQESFMELFSSMFVAVILILIILVMVFNSFRQTAIVLATIPLAIIGVFPGLALLGLPLSFPAFLGVVMLTGIVVNDAIVLMDQINNNRNNGIPLLKAISNGAQSRLIPVILTSITTIFGLLPITLKDEFWRGLGFSVIFGLIAATFLTLVIIPILYSIFYRKQA